MNSVAPKHPMYKASVYEWLLKVVMVILIASLYCTTSRLSHSASDLTMKTRYLGDIMVKNPSQWPCVKLFCSPLYNSISDIRPCGLHCAGRYGMAPSLHCDICMCMFHPECVGITHVPHRTSFTCKVRIHPCNIFTALLFNYIYKINMNNYDNNK